MLADTYWYHQKGFLYAWYNENISTFTYFTQLSDKSFAHKMGSHSVGAF